MMENNITPDFATLGTALASVITRGMHNPCIVYDIGSGEFSHQSDLVPMGEDEMILARNLDVAEWGIETEEDAHNYAAQPEIQHIWLAMIADAK